MDYTIIDTHVHAWDLKKNRYTWLDGDTTILNRSYSIDELETAHTEAGVSFGVFVQAANSFEDTDYMLAECERKSWMIGAVGWLPLMDPDATEKVLTQKYSVNKYFKGVRHLIHNESDVEWLLQDRVLESLGVLAKHNLPFDVVGTSTEHIETALQVAEKIPSLFMVFDHLNQPPISTGHKFGRWGELMREASTHQNLYAKISGLGTTTNKRFGEWTSDDIKPYVAFILETFESDRCFCGGDWPVSLLASDYVRTWRNNINVLQDLLGAEDQAKVFARNAIRFYDL